MEKVPFLERHEAQRTDQEDEKGGDAGALEALVGIGSAVVGVLLDGKPLHGSRKLFLIQRAAVVVVHLLHELVHLLRGQ